MGLGVLFPVTTGTNIGKALFLIHIDESGFDVGIREADL
jgi:hypothetical protein